MLQGSNRSTSLAGQQLSNFADGADGCSWHIPVAASPPVSSGLPSPPATAASSGASSGSAKACAGFAGWEAEEQLSACWGSRNSSFCSSAGGLAQPVPPWLAGGNRPGSAGSTMAGAWAAGGQAAGRANSTGSRPGSAPCGRYMSYTIRRDAIEEVLAGGVEEAAEQGPHAGYSQPSTGGEAGAASAVAERRVWAPVRYPQLFAGAGAAESRRPQHAPAAAEDDEEEQPQLEEEPSAPPLPCDEPWATCGDAAAHRQLAASAATPDKAVRFVEAMGSSGSVVVYGRVSPGSGSCKGSASSSHQQQWQQQEYGRTWGIASAVCVAALAGSQRAPAGSKFDVAPAAADGSPSRQVSEETGRYLLETLAARRREAAAAGAGAYPTASKSVPLMALRPASSEGETHGWQSPLLRSPTGAVAAAAHSTSAASRPCAARWTGMQTLLGNLQAAAASIAPAPTAGVSFWDLPMTDEEEAPDAAVEAAAVISSGPSCSVSINSGGTLQQQESLELPCRPLSAAPAGARRQKGGSLPAMRHVAPPSNSPRRSAQQQQLLQQQSVPASPRLLSRWWAGSGARPGSGTHTTTEHVDSAPLIPPPGVVRRFAPLSEC